MQLYFIRHAQSENNANWGNDDYQESHDPELTDIAHLQVECLARYLGANRKLDDSSTWNPQNRYGFGLTHMYTSLMVRAVGTAVPVAQAIGLPVIAWPEIHETGGVFSRFPEDDRRGLPGKPRSYFETNFPDLILPGWLDELGWWQSRPFEIPEICQRRAKAVWDELLIRHADRDDCPEHRVAIISHGGFFMHLLTTALGVEMRQIKEFEHEYWFLKNNCAITRIDIHDEHVLIAYVNRTDFLPDNLIT
jgi:2,3-bisphosphoglycerate-dependent phosphoglycerate mutase